MEFNTKKNTTKTVKIKFDEEKNSHMFIITAEYQKLEKKDKLEFIAQLIKWCSDELK